MYESPIRLVEQISSDISKQKENDIYNVVCKYAVDVNKEELLHALQYDRDQYNKGYKDGHDDCLGDLIKYLKEHSFLCDPGNGHSFMAIDMDGLAEEFFDKKRVLWGG